jgi:acetyl esterase/lipase
VPKSIRLDNISRGISVKLSATVAALVLLLAAYGTVCQAAPPASEVEQPPNAGDSKREKAYQQRQESLLPEGTTVARDVNYAGTKDRYQTLDLFVPPEAKSQPVPVVVWIHGGGWVTGGKKSRMSLKLVPRGFAVANIEYRFSNEAIWPAQMYDCKAAIRWLRAHANQYNLDPKHIGVWGASAGGQLVLMLGTTGGIKSLEGDEGNKKYSSDVQLVADWFGPTDFTHIAEQIPKADPHHQSPIDALDLVSKLLGGPIPTHLEQAKQASPITFLSKSSAPTLIVHGDADHIVPVEQSREYCDEAKRLGADVTLHVVPNGGHGDPNFTPEIYEQTLVFFDRLKGQSGSSAHKRRRRKLQGRDSNEPLPEYPE